MLAKNCYHNITHIFYCWYPDGKSFFYWKCRKMLHCKKFCCLLTFGIYFTLVRSNNFKITAVWRACIKCLTKLMLHQKHDIFHGKQRQVRRQRNKFHIKTNNFEYCSRNSSNRSNSTKKFKNVKSSWFQN